MDVKVKSCLLSRDIMVILGEEWWATWRAYHECKAVNRNNFTQLVNVVVFSSKGQRPEQNKMLGGVLDDNFYKVIWNSELVKDFKESDLRILSKASDLKESCNSLSFKLQQQIWNSDIQDISCCSKLSRANQS